MEENRIQIFAEERSIGEIDLEPVKGFLEKVFSDFNYDLGSLNVVLLSDESLKRINVDFLGHDYFTDVITFDLSNNEGKKEGEIYVSVDRIVENAQKFDVNFEEEINRVFIHGVLHLVGFGDKTLEAKKQMSEQENYYLNQLKS